MGLLSTTYPAKEIIMSGGVGWRRKVQRREREGKGYYRHERSTLSSRDKKKLGQERGKISRKMLERRKLK